jgi:nickel/cobalt transporter (NicO) family protein
MRGRAHLVVMGLVALAGVGSGALHAVAGPDHLLSLAPMSLARPRGAWKLGLIWGLGHAVGVLVAASMLMFVLSAVQLEGVDRWAERVAAVALIAMGLAGMRRVGAQHGGPDSSFVRRGAFLVGLVHGVTGAAALLLILPTAISGTGLEKALFLGGFSFGSTVAMGALTAGLSALAKARRVSSAFSRHLPRVASALSVVLGGAWMVRSF